MNPRRVLLHFRPGPDLQSRLDALQDGSLEIVTCPADDDAHLAALLPGVDAIWHVLRPLTAADIAAAPKLRLIQKIGVGVNTIDLEAAKARGIAVCNMPGTNSRAVAEMALTLMLAALRRLSLFDRAMRKGAGWQVDPVEVEKQGELGGRVVGLVGYGAVPRMLAPWLETMGADVRYWSRRPVAGAVGRHMELDSLIAASDILSLHVPLAPDTAGLLSAARIGTMRPGAIVVNTARGGLVDQPALVAALASGQLGAAGLDVFADEPVAAKDPVLALPNVVMAPHVAWLTGETWDRSFAVARENVRRIGSSEPFLHRVA